MIYTGIVVLVVLSASLVLWHEYKRTRPSGAEGELRCINMPQEATEAVARFAWLCGVTRDRLKAMGALNDEFFSEAVFAFTLGGAGEDATAAFSFCFDWQMVGFFPLMGYELGEGLRIEDGNRVVFTTDHMTGLDAALPPENREAWIMEVFQGQCPDAVATSVRHTPQDMTICFHFK